MKLVHWCCTVLGSSVILYWLDIPSSFITWSPAAFVCGMWSLTAHSCTAEKGSGSWQRVILMSFVFDEPPFFLFQFPTWKGTKDGVKKLDLAQYGAARAASDQDECFQWKLKLKKRKKGWYKVTQSDIRTSEHDLPLSWPHLKVSG